MIWTYRALPRLVLLSSVLILAPGMCRLAWGRQVTDCALRIGSGALDSPFLDAVVPVTLDNAGGLAQTFRIVIAFGPTIATATAIEPLEGVLALNPESISPLIIPEQGLLALEAVINPSPGQARRGNDNTLQS